MSDLNKTLRVADRNVGIDALLEGKAVRLPPSDFSNSGVPLARFIPLANSDAGRLRPDYRYVRKIEILVVWNADSERADVVEGGDGGDLLLGGVREDVLNGGAGQDCVYRSRTGGLTYPLNTTSAPRVASGPECTRGLGSVTFDGGTNNGLTTSSLSGTVALGRDLSRVVFAAYEGA